MTNRRVRKHIHIAVRYYTIEGGEGRKEREEWSGGRTGAALGGVGLELLLFVKIIIIWNIRQLNQ